MRTWTATLGSPHMVPTPPCHRGFTVGMVAAHTQHKASRGSQLCTHEFLRGGALFLPRIPELGDLAICTRGTSDGRTDDFRIRDGALPVTEPGRCCGFVKLLRGTSVLGGVGFFTDFVGSCVIWESMSMF